LRQAATEAFVGLTREHGLRRLLDSLCERAGFAPHLAFEGEEHETLRGLVRAGLGVAVLPRATHHDPAPREPRCWAVAESSSAMSVRPPTA
jgi:DNA-binding transcriptional LysR family regulator